VYTPTQNIVYHNFQPNPDGHGVAEWMRPRFQRQRKASVERIKAYLNLPEGDTNLNLANLGIYGLGKRRTLKQMEDFVGLDMEHQKGRAPTVRNSACMILGHAERETYYGDRVLPVSYDGTIFLPCCVSFSMTGPMCKSSMGTIRYQHLSSRQSL
jgi:hypothetical protein